ncbi:MAG TPA: 4-hydroxy-tetrahydrodipicolinate reductase [Clostridia bacterium]|nr:4-hydroxy-tetrahydrodipicolinate reductase [Clostridia bacterium]
MLKVGLIGYGKMGQMLHKLSNDFSIEVKAIIDPFHEKATGREITKQNLRDCDVCIDFTTPAVILENIGKLVELKMPVVVGTTGWYDDLEKVKEMVEKNNTTLMFGSNYSIGVNILFKMISYGSKLMNQVKGYDVAGFESHHRMKKDIPSGTAETIANIILNQYDRKDKVTYQPGNRAIDKNELHFTSMRCGNINGLHEVIFDSKEDQISIKHEARNREGFAKGALMAAHYIVDKKGTFEFKDYFDDILEGINDDN